MFRWFAVVVFLASLGVSAQRRWQARRVGGTIPRSQEPAGLIAGRVFVALPLFVGVIAYLANPRWMAWASLTYLIGTHLLPEAHTKADVGELLRTIAFASAPGLFRLFGVVPFLGLTIYAIASLWMLVAMIVAVRQALDFKSTSRAVGVCVIGWALSLIVAAVIGILFAPTVS